MLKNHKRSTDGDTEFKCHAPNAQSVFLAGAFNEWNPGATPMQRTDDFIWTTSLNLAPGRYEYKFVVDGVWCCEPGCKETALCPHCVPNAFGTMNRVVEVRAVEAS